MANFKTVEEEIASATKYSDVVKPMTRKLRNASMLKMELAFDPSASGAVADIMEHMAARADEADELEAMAGQLTGSVANVAKDLIFIALLSGVLLGIAGTLSINALFGL